MRGGGVVSVPGPGTEIRPLSMRVWHPNHWTAREIPRLLFFFKVNFYLKIHTLKWLQMKLYDVWNLLQNNTGWGFKTIQDGGQVDEGINYKNETRWP